MKQSDLNEILTKHKRWSNNEEGGEIANLRCANLRGADLRYADLRCANLRCANLRDAGRLVSGTQDSEGLRVRYFDAFAGIGGFALGIQRAVNALEQRRSGQEKGQLETAIPDTINVVQAIFTQLFTTILEEQKCTRDLKLSDGWLQPQK